MNLFRLRHFLAIVLTALCCLGSGLVIAQLHTQDSAYVDQLYAASKKFWGVNNDSALLYLRRSEDLSDKLGFKKGKAFALYGYGIVEGTLYRRFQYHTASLELFEEIRHPFGIGLNLVKIGEIYTHLGELDKALDYYRRSLAVKKKLDDFGGIALALINIGQNQKFRGQLDSALLYFQESLIYRRKVGAHQGIAYAYTNIGDALLAKNAPLPALNAADSAVHHFSFTGDVSGKTMALIVKATALLKLNKNAEAENAFRAITGFPSNTAPLGSVLYAKKALIDFAQKRGDLKEMVALQADYITGKEHLDANDYRTETQRLVNEFEFKTAVLKAQEKKNQEAVVISRRNNLENLIIAALVMVVFVILFSGRRKIPASMANAVLFIGLLLLFEFLLVLTDSFVENITGGEPILKLLSNVVLALMILPVHQFLEKYIQKRILGA